MARSVRTRHLRAHSRSELWLQSYGRSRRARSPASFAQPNVRLERQPASNGPDRSSSFREGRGAEPPSPAPRHHIKRTHPLPRLVTQTLQERREPSPKLAFPTCPRARHGRPSIKPTTHESLKI